MMDEEDTYRPTQQRSYDEFEYELDEFDDHTNDRHPNSGRNTGRYVNQNFRAGYNRRFSTSTTVAHLIDNLDDLSVEDRFGNYSEKSQQKLTQYIGTAESDINE